jgi:hypothetical protein
VPSYQDHLAQARANTALYEKLRDNGLTPEWQAVLLFYAAVHYVEALGDVDGHHSHNHAERESYIKANHPKEFWTLYDQLKQESLKARYLTNAPWLTGSAWRRGAFSLTAEKIEARLYRAALAGVRAYTEKKIPPSVSTTPKPETPVPVVAAPPPQ